MIDERSNSSERADCVARNSAEVAKDVSSKEKVSNLKTLFLVKYPSIIALVL